LSQGRHAATPMPAVPEHPLKLSARSFSGTPISQQLSAIWGKKAIPKLCDGLKTYFIDAKKKRPGLASPSPISSVYILYVIKAMNVEGHLSIWRTGRRICNTVGLANMLQ